MPRRSTRFRIFHRWLVFSGIALFGVFVALHNGLLGALLAADSSHLSALILAIMLVASTAAGRRAYLLDRELDQAAQLAIAARRRDPLFATPTGDEVEFREDGNTHSFAHAHVLLLANKTLRNGRLDPQDLLLERLENAIGRGHETGWFLAELMIRLGLLGTVIGFIFMLGSIANVASVDVQALQQLLTNMSSGMRIALYTTLTGLAAGILLGFQYRLLDAGVDRLMAEIIELSEVHVAGHLRRLIGD